jgi:hypothetical protein
MKVIKYIRSVLQAFRQRDCIEKYTRTDTKLNYINISLLHEEKTIYLDTVSWFWGNLSNGQAEYLLQDTQDGTFVVRHSIDETSLYCITYKLDGVVASVRVYENDGQLSINFDDPLQIRAATLHGLIAKLVRLSANGGFVCKLERSSKVLSLQLTRPVNRLSSLRAHCKRVIRMSMPHETMNALVLPKHVKSFLLGSAFSWCWRVKLGYFIVYWSWTWSLTVQQYHQYVISFACCSSGLVIFRSVLMSIYLFIDIVWAWLFPMDLRVKTLRIQTLCDPVIEEHSYLDTDFDNIKMVYKK